MGEKQLVRLCRIESGEDELIPGERYKNAAVRFEDGSRFVLARAESLDGPTDLILVVENLREGAHHEIIGILNFSKAEIDLLDNNERMELLRQAVMSRYSDDPTN